MDYFNAVEYVRKSKQARMKPKMIVEQLKKMGCDEMTMMLVSSACFAKKKS